MDDSVSDIIQTRTAWAARIIGISIIGLVGLQIGLFLLLFAFFGAQTAAEWLAELVLAVLFTLLLGAVAVYVMGQGRRSGRGPGTARVEIGQ